MGAAPARTFAENHHRARPASLVTRHIPALGLRTSDRFLACEAPRAQVSGS